MRPDDAETVALLAGQLGYTTNPAESALRHAAIEAGPDRGVVLVAEDADPVDRPAVVGWAHVELRDTLVAPAAAQLMALVVGDGARGRGVGRDLLRAAETWAADRGCLSLLVATRVTRTDAHRFYRREGYDLDQTSHIFVNSLDPAG